MSIKERWRRMLLWLLCLLACGGMAQATEINLVEAINRGLEHSYGVKSATSDSAAAYFRWQKARTQRFPVLSLDVRTYYVDRLQQLKTPFLTMQLGTKENYLANFKLAAPLYTGGRLSRSIALEQAASRAEASRLKAERMNLAFQVRQAYFALMLAEVGVTTTAASTERVTIIRRNVQNLYDYGLADSVDILDAETALERARRATDQAGTGRRNAMTTLATLLGVGTASELQPGETLVPPDGMRLPDTTRPLEITRAELERLEHLIHAAEEASKLAVSDYAPIFSGFGGYSYGKPNQDMFEKSWNGYFSVGAALTWEFNVGGKTSRAVAAAQEVAGSARQSREALHESLVIQAAAARNNVVQAARVITSTAAEYDIAQRKFALAQGRQKEGTLSVNRLLEMETELTTAQQQYQAALVQFYLTRSDYLYAIGSPEIFGGL